MQEEGKGMWKRGDPYLEAPVGGEILCVIIPVQCGIQTEGLLLLLLL
jgi:hypothetical protein